MFFYKFQTQLEGLMCLQCKTEELQTKTGAFQMEHPAINLLLFTQLLNEAKGTLDSKRERLVFTVILSHDSCMLYPQI